MAGDSTLELVSVEPVFEKTEVVGTSGSLNIGGVGARWMMTTCTLWKNKASLFILLFYTLVKLCQEKKKRIVLSSCKGIDLHLFLICLLCKPYGVDIMLMYEAIWPRGNYLRLSYGWEAEGNSSVL